MNPWLIGGLVAGLGLLKNREAKKQWKAEQDINTAKARTSPWLGMKPDSMRDKPSLIGDAAGSALSGYDFAQKANLWDKVKEMGGANSAALALANTGSGAPGAYSLGGSPGNFNVDPELLKILGG